MSELEASGLEALYPFLYSATSDLDAVLARVRQSTVDKAREITALRREVCQAQGGRLLACARDMATAFGNGGRLLAFGNGGSSTDAQDLASLFLSPPGDSRPLPAFGLTNDIAVVTALSNDIGFDVVFARQVGAFGRRGDIAVGLSTSGNSANLLRGFDEAARRGLMTVGIAGYDGGKMAELDTIDYLFVVPSPSVHRIQEAQTTLYHALWELSLAALAAQDAGRANPAPRAGHHQGHVPTPEGDLS
ncbi:MAG: D-sedoheptulose 7-phosphate isomerase [Amycolatopsis sp.]|uniref:D-sedoheptulose-7-phosphate isomerase n=1 Tax=Amycolatopsis sp. TaxID=37632 RepID=UPI002638C5B5|nr:SIS domain-containing protein [Amycolatopsis sp.]MCU1683566.1 D-sedoheptulose 7-phosphate isomerase [Amycolatopsis sp.]